MSIHEQFHHFIRLAHSGLRRASGDNKPVPLGRLCNVKWVSCAGLCKPWMVVPAGEGREGRQVKVNSSNDKSLPRQGMRGPTASSHHVAGLLEGCAIVQRQSLQETGWSATEPRWAVVRGSPCRGAHAEQFWGLAHRPWVLGQLRTEDRQEVLSAWG